MITEKTKAIAKARLRQCISAEEIAEELEIPLKLVEEWASNISSKDMVMQEATLLAVDKINNKIHLGEVMPLTLDILKDILEETAIDITKAMALPALSGDMVHAKAIQLMADAIVKLYQVLILKSDTATGKSGSPNSTALDTFAEMMKD